MARSRRAFAVYPRKCLTEFMDGRQMTAPGRPSPEAHGTADRSECCRLSAKRSGRRSRSRLSVLYSTTQTPALCLQDRCRLRQFDTARHNAGSRVAQDAAESQLLWRALLRTRTRMQARLETQYFRQAGQ